MTSALDLILGGKVLIPSFPPGAASTGNPNLVGGDSTFGSGGALIGAQGNVYVFAANGTAGGLQPSGTGAEYVVAAFSIPANTFDQPGRGITVTCSGSFSATSTTGKLVRIVFNPTTGVVGGTVGLGAGGVAIATTSSGSFGGSAFNVTGSVFKYGAPGSNTQVCIHNATQIGSAVGALNSPTGATATESGTILVVITAQSGSTGTAGLVNDVVISYIEITACN